MKWDRFTFHSQPFPPVQNIPDQLQWNKGFNVSVQEPLFKDKRDNCSFFFHCETINSHSLASPEFWNLFFCWCWSGCRSACITSFISLTGCVSIQWRLEAVSRYCTPGNQSWSQRNRTNYLYQGIKELGRLTRLPAVPLKCLFSCSTRCIITWDLRRHLAALPHLISDTNSFWRLVSPTAQQKLIPVTAGAFNYVHCHDFF